MSRATMIVATHDAYDSSMDTKQARYARTSSPVSSLSSSHIPMLSVPQNIGEA